jgi:hypothetical protein
VKIFFGSGTFQVGRSATADKQYFILGLADHFYYLIKNRI